jgi:probable HAF family extracellular repeat protein
MTNRSIIQLAALALGVGLLLGAVYLGLEAGPAAADSPPVASRTPGNIDFGSQQASTTSAPRTITVTAVSDGSETFCNPMLKPPCETSDDPTSISNPTIGGTNSAAFSVSSQSCTGKYLWQGQTCSIDVTFSPAAVGSYSATLTINSNSSWSTGNQVQLSGNAPPPNDAFASAQTLGSTVASVNGTTDGATREPDEPDHYTYNPADADSWLGDHTVWYRWKAPDSETTTIDTCRANIDSILAVYTGGELSNLSRVADSNNGCPSGWGSKVTFNATAGTTYNIAVGDAGGARESTFTLKLPTSAASTTYTIKDLGTLPGFTSSAAQDVNDSGEVVGYSYTPNGAYHAFLYSGGQMQDLGTLGQPGSQAYSINDSGQVVGRLEVSGTSSYRPFLYSDGQMQDLGTLPGYVSSEAYDINASGQVVGTSSNTFADTRAFLYTDGQMKNLGTLGGNRSHASSINDSGQVVGDSRTSSGEVLAFLYSGGQMEDIGTLEGGTSYATDISDGEIVGLSYTSSGERRAFLKLAGTPMKDLGTLGGPESWAHDTNDSGQVVGTSRTSDGDFDSHSFLYSEGQMQDLTDLFPAGSGWEYYHADAINSSGQIAGTGTINGQTRAFLATPETTPQEDTTNPQITITTPPQGATYTVGQTLAARYGCTDEDSGVASCEGPVADGANIDTSSTGTKTFTVRATDNAGNTNSVSHTYTINAPTTAPTVTSTAPAANATGVAPGVNVSATFSEAMLTNSINGTTFKLMKAGTTTAIRAIVSYNATAKKATLNPNANLQLGTKYTAVVSTGAKDAAGNPLDQDPATQGSQPKQWVFTVRR